MAWKGLPGAGIAIARVSGSSATALHFDSGERVATQEPVTNERPVSPAVRTRHELDPEQHLRERTFASRETR